MACHAVAAERGYVSREHAVERVLATLRFFWNAEQSERSEATGYRGFFYHFLDVLPERPFSCKVAREGIEPPTRGFSVRCSTN